MDPVGWVMIILSTALVLFVVFKLGRRANRGSKKLVKKPKKNRRGRPF